LLPEEISPGRSADDVTPEIAANSAAIAVSMAYYPENCYVADDLSKPGSQSGVDIASKILKEFRPDLERKFSRKYK
jgi:hypothetical protein